MTIINLNFSRDRAAMATDTLVFETRDGTYRPTCFLAKFTLLPTLHGVVACRGDGRLHDMTAAWLGSVYLPDGIDSLPAMAPKALGGLYGRRCSEMFAACAELGRPDPEEIPGDFWLVAYSRARARFRAFRFDWREGFEARELEPGTYLNPDFGQAAPAVLDDVPATFAQVADLQHKMMREHGAQEGGGMSVGGELHLVELTPKAMRVRTIHRFADYAVVAAEIAGLAGIAA